MIVRKATIDDLNSIVEYKIRMFKDAGLLEILSNECMDKIISTYKGLYLEDKAVHYILEEDSIVVSISGGFIKNDIPYCFFEKSYYGFIGDMYTIPKYSRKGHAKLLLQKTISWLQSKGVSQIKLLSSKDGKHMYEAFGFKPNSAEMILELGDVK